MILENIKEISLAIVAVGVAATIILPDFRSRRRVVSVVAISFASIVTLTDYWLIAKSDRGLDDRIACLLYPDEENCRAQTTHFEEVPHDPFESYTEFWEFEPLYNANWSNIDNRRIARLFNAMNAPHSELLDINGVRILAGRVANLSFLGNTDVYEVEIDSGNGPTQLIAAVALPGGPVVLDGTNAPIYKIAAAGKLRLDTADEVEQYIRFFLSYVRGRHGLFDLVEDSSSLNWAPSATFKRRQDIAKTVSPLRLVSHDGDEKTWVFSGFSAFRDSLFAAQYTVDAAGLLQIRDEELLFEELPLRELRFDFKNWGFEIVWIEHKGARAEKAEEATETE